MRRGLQLQKLGGDPGTIGDEFREALNGRDGKPLLQDTPAATRTSQHPVR